MIYKKTEISTAELNLFPIQGKNIELSFNGDRISSDGGLLLLRELDSQLNLLSSASNCIYDERDQRYIDHSDKELLTQRVFQIAAGYEDCNDCNDLREDMIFKMCAGRLPQSENDLASQPTMSRLENTVTRTDLFRLGKCLVDMFISSYSKAPSVIILDCDDTNNDTYGQQELALFNNFYNEHCYIPIHIYEGLPGKLITTILRPVAGISKPILPDYYKNWYHTFGCIGQDKDYRSWRQPFCVTGFYGLDMAPT
jgi:hypothetical protein